MKNEKNNSSATNPQPTKMRLTVSLERRQAMDDYIKRSDAIEALHKAHSQYPRRRFISVEAIKKIPAADVWPLRVGENITENNPVDEFVCSECGIILEDWSMVEIDEDDGERTNHEYAFRYCPNCGKPMK